MMISLIKKKKWILGITTVLLISLGLGLGLGLGLKKDDNKALEQKLLETKELLAAEKKLLVAEKTKNSKANAEILKLGRLKDEAESTAEVVQNSLIRVNNELKNKEKELRKKEEVIRDKNDSISFYKKEEDKAQKKQAYNYGLYEDLLVAKVAEEKKLNKELEDVKKELETKETSELELDSDTYKAEADSVNEMLAEKKEEIKVLKQEINLLKQEIEADKAADKVEAAFKKARLKQLNKAVKIVQIEIAKNSQLQEKIKELGNENKQQTDKIKQLERTEETLKKFILKLGNEIKNKEKEIQQLKETIVSETREWESEEINAEEVKDKVTKSWEKIKREQPAIAHEWETTSGAGTENENWEWCEKPFKSEGEGCETESEREGVADYQAENRKLKSFIKKTKPILLSLSNIAYDSPNPDSKSDHWSTSEDSAISRSPEFMDVESIQIEVITLDLSDS